MLLTIIKRSIRYIKVKNAVDYANKFADATKSEMFVIQINKKIRVYDRPRINKLIDVGVLSKDLNYDDTLRKACIYTTYNRKRK